MSELSINLPADYYLLVLGASTGLIQIVAAWSRLWGLLFVPRVYPSYAIGAALLAGSFAWFVLTGNPGIPGDVGGVEGSQQFGLFLAGTASAVLLTGVAASLTQRFGGGPAAPLAGDGFDRLRSLPWLAALDERIKRRRPRA